MSWCTIELLRAQDTDYCVEQDCPSRPVAYSFFGLGKDMGVSQTKRCGRGPNDIFVGFENYLTGNSFAACIHLAVTSWDVAHARAPPTCIMSKDAVSQDKLMTEAILKEQRFEFKEFRPFKQHKTPKEIAINPAKVDPNAHFKKVAQNILSKGDDALRESTVPEVREEKFGYETSSNAVG